jgi:hypothetical protein
MYARIAAIAATLVMAVAVVLFGVSQSSPAGAGVGATNTSDKLSICHATGSQTHPYSMPTVPKHQLVHGYGHGDHSGDIWPPFSFEGQAYNGQGNQSVYAANCGAPCPTAQQAAQRGLTTDPVPSATPIPCTVPTVPTGTPTVPPVVSACPPANLFNAIRGNAKPNNMVGTPCRDVMNGHGGGDTMFGAGETDIMLGGRGPDKADGGTGVDTLRGGFGNDRLVSNDGTPGDRLIGGLGNDLCVIDPGDSARQCERVVKQ